MSACRMSRTMLALAFSLGVIASSNAEQVNNQTTCKFAVGAYDNADKPLIANISAYVLLTLDKLNQADVAKGEPSILTRMSADGLMSISVTPIELCRGDLTATLYSQVVKTYEGISAAERTLAPP